MLRQFLHLKNKQLSVKKTKNNRPSRLEVKLHYFVNTIQASKMLLTMWINGTYLAPKLIFQHLQSQHVQWP